MQLSDSLKNLLKPRRIESFFYGFTLPLKAAKLILRSPRLILWSLIPLALTIGIYLWIIVAIQVAVKSWVALTLMPWLGLTPDSFAAVGLLLIFQLVLLLVGAVTFSFVGGVAASPFNDFLAEATERFCTPPLPPIPSQGVGGKLGILWIDFIKTLAATSATIVALAASWIPIINLFAFSTAFLLAAFQYISYPQTRRGVGVREGAFFLVRHLFACMGFGCAITLLFAIPLVASLCLPIAVVGGTLLVARAPGSRELGLEPLK